MLHEKTAVQQEVQVENARTRLRTAYKNLGDALVCLDEAAQMDPKVENLALVHASDDLSEVRATVRRIFGSI